MELPQCMCFLDRKKCVVYCSVEKEIIPHSMDGRGYYVVDVETYQEVTADDEGSVYGDEEEGVFLAAASRGWAGWTPPPPPPPPWLATAGQKWPGGKFGQNQGKRRKNGHTWGP